MPCPLLIIGASSPTSARSPSEASHDCYQRATFSIYCLLPFRSADPIKDGRSKRAEPGDRGRTAQSPSPLATAAIRSAEHTSELQSLMRLSYAVFCLKKKKNLSKTHTHTDDRTQLS